MVKLRVGVFAHSHLSGMVVKFTLVAPHALQGTRIIELGAKAKAVKFPAKTKAAMLCAKDARLEVNAMMEDLGGRGGLRAPLSQKDSPNQGHGPSQLTAELEAAQDSNSSSHGAYPSNQQGDFGHVGSLVVGSSGSGSDDDYLAWFRQRKTSISFNDEVRLDSGEGVGLGVPVPKSARQSQSRHPGNGSYSDEHDYLELPYAARRGMQYHIGGSRFPLSQAPIDGLARNNEYPDQIAALTSDATALLDLDGSYRKHHPGLGSSYQTALAPHLAHGVVAFVTSSWIEAMQGRQCAQTMTFRDG
ncbi:hypothetical protein COCHEDRAFT_1228117 [Bipolaris maydis C5]|uniref:Uncharacterized protein n=1 Tax=Cochliobolus heterostrophus (strain C5 / ATCC 48332 / race O) TaxID=701091 RepID=M2TJC8_COCH5|nr:hypothetical protein COCHEDRAFT_1228117 [Bipolaris maydis C5]KAJ5051164.1 hypothetical protein J3E74DRAFT_422960 [Bipolaris maydis]KAJ5052648.1 hypothetical protein J3E74DRAFT_422879 [Bipolaris maydis]KAJ6192318.1 hypothetical protein J3E72DRAFT_389797 [Bipolaris maydis]KAJ6203802.1 hypothetical protein PSV09DRAFT_1228117 [Bipolaris maydis]